MKNLLEFQDVKVLSKTEQKKVNGGSYPPDHYLVTCSNGEQTCFLEEGFAQAYGEENCSGGYSIQLVFTTSC